MYIGYLSKAKKSFRIQQQFIRKKTTTFYCQSFQPFFYYHHNRCHSDSFQFEIIRKTTLEYNRGVENKSAILSSISEEDNTSMAEHKEDDDEHGYHEYDIASINCGDSENSKSVIDDDDGNMEIYDAVSVTAHEYDDLEKMSEYMFSQDFSPTGSNESNTHLSM